MSLSAKDATLIAAVSGVTTLNVFLSGALTVALPTIGKDLNFRQADLQWPVNVNALSYGCLLLFFGRVGDIIGGRTMFIAGSAWFAAWSLATPFAPNDKASIIFMAMEGLGSACNTPAGIGIFSAYFPPGPKRNIAYGALGAGQPVGFIMGLVLGGILTESRATWRAIFFFQAGLGFFFVALGWLVLAKEQNTPLYTKGLDWGGAILSTTGFGLLAYSLADSTTARKGWSTPEIPSLLSVSVVLLTLFLYYERWREAKNMSVLVPMSMWRYPGARMGSVIALVFFAWYEARVSQSHLIINELIRWAFNTVAYFATLYYQQVKLLSPLQTSLRFIAMAMAGFCVNVVTGFVMGRVPGQMLILIGLSGTVAASLIFALIDVDSCYWAMMFLVMIFVVGADVVYPVGNLHIASTFDEDSQSLAGGVFNVATRIGTSIGLAVTSSIATAISKKYASAHPLLPADSPEVLMVGFRAAGWTCFAAAVLAFLIGVVGLRGIGVVGQQKKTPNPAEITADSSAINLPAAGNNEKLSVEPVKD